MSRSRILCDCGCGRRVFPNELTYVVVESATDETLRHTKVDKRYRVTHTCKRPFEEELALENGIQRLAIKWAFAPKTVWQKVNLIRTLHLWIVRIQVARDVMRMQHAVWERRRGFDYARNQALCSFKLMACPRFMQEWLAQRYWKKKVRYDSLAEQKNASPDAIQA